MFHAIGRFSVKFRWPIVILWLLAVPILSYTLPTLASKASNDYSSLLPSSSPTKQAQALGGHFTTTNTNPSGGVVIIATKNGQVLSPADNAAIDSLVTKLGKLAGVTEVVNNGISPDSQARELTIKTTSGTFSGDSSAIVSTIRSTVSDSLPSTLVSHFTGQLPSQADADKGNTSSQKSTEVLTVVMIIVLLIIVFRAVLAPLVTLLPAGIALVIAAPLIAAATSIGVSVSFTAQLLLIVLVLGAGTDYGLFLVFRVREELRKGKDAKTAVVDAVTKVGESITFSAVTVIAALLCLMLATFGLYKGLGPSLAIGLAVMLCAALTFLPALLAILGKAVFWPSNIMSRKVSMGIWGRIASSATKRPKTIIVTGVLGLLLLASAIYGYNATGFNNSVSPSGSDSANGQALAAQHYPKASQNGQLLVVQLAKSAWADPGQLSTIEQSLVSSSQFMNVTGPVASNGGQGLSATQLTALRTALGDPTKLPVQYSPIKGVPAAAYYGYIQSSKLISNDGMYAEFYVDLTAGEGGSPAAMNAIPAARQALQDAAAKVNAVSTGILSSDAAAYDVSSAASNDLTLIFPIVLVVIMVLLAILLRSIIAPIYLILSVALSYFATLGFAMLVFVHSGDLTGLNFVLPFMLFVFSMALGEDYNILIMSRIREESLVEGKHTTAAITRAIGVTGTTVTSAGIILAASFAILGLVGGTVQVQQIGYSIAFGILLDTFFVRTLLVPSIATLLGRYNWWPSKLSRVLLGSKNKR